jgi:hypothetical protein
MSQELHYTSAPKGLKPGSYGYCTVAATAGLSGPLMDRLEGLSGYRPVFPPHDPSAARNPVIHAHLRVPVGGRTFRVLSRVCFADLDYTNRTNKYAHHLVLDDNELPGAGPARLLSQPGFLEEKWTGEPGVIAQGRPIPLLPRGDALPGVCARWRDRTGDAGWGGVVAESLRDYPNRLVYLEFEPGMELLPLIAESLALLPPTQRWSVTFSTYFTSLPSDVACTIRGVLRDSEEAKTARRHPNALVIDLTRSLDPPNGGALVRQAQTGEAPPVVATVAPPPLPEPEPIGRRPGRPVKVESLAPRPPESETYGFAEPPPLLPPAIPTSRKRGGKPSKRNPTALIAAGTTALGALLLIGLAFALWSAQQSNADLERKNKTLLAELEEKNKDLEAKVADLNSQSDRFSERERRLNGQIEQLQEQLDEGRKQNEKRNTDPAGTNGNPDSQQENVAGAAGQPSSPGGSSRSGNPDTVQPAPPVQTDAPKKQDEPGRKSASVIQSLKEPLPPTSSQEPKKIITFEGPDKDKKILGLKLKQGTGSLLHFNDGADGKSWTVTFKTLDSSSKEVKVVLAHFGVNDSSVSFQWSESAGNSNDAIRSASQTLRDCVLSVEREGQDPERHLLRTVVTDEMPFDVAKKVQGERNKTKPRHEFGFPVSWKDEGRPRGQIYLGKVLGEWKSRNGPKQKVEFSDVSKRASSVPLILGTYSGDGTTIKLTISVPDNKGQAAPDDKKEADAKVVSVSFNPPAHEMYASIVDLERIWGARSDPPTPQEIAYQNKLEFCKNASESYFLSLSVSLFVEVDGVPVEVARIGDF